MIFVRLLLLEMGIIAKNDFIYRVSLKRDDHESNFVGLFSARKGIVAKRIISALQIADEEW